jgi:hypothetical protein
MRKAVVSLKEPKTVEECLELQSHFIGIPKISKKNAQEFYKRGKTIEILGVGFLENGRMPTRKEVEENIGLTTNANPLDDKAWNNAMVGILNDMTKERIRQEEELSDVLEEPEDLGHTPELLELRRSSFPMEVANDAMEVRNI